MFRGKLALTTWLLKSVRRTNPADHRSTLKAVQDGMRRIASLRVLPYPLVGIRLQLVVIA
jgi:hypothetical protein